MSNEFIKRLHEERTQLDERVLKLESFVFSDTYNTLYESEQTDLRLQLYHMKAYLQIVSRRLSRLAGDA